MATEGRKLRHKQSGRPPRPAKSIPKMKLTSPRAWSRWVQSQENLPFQTFQALIETLGEFKIITDPDGRIDAIWNSLDSTERFYSRCLLGCRLNEIVTSQLMTQISDLARRTAILARREDLQCQVNVREMQRWFSVSAIPLDCHGRDSLVMCLVARDVTRKKQAVKELVEREALLARAERAVNFGSWELDFKTQKVSLSSQLMKIYEVESADNWSVDIYWERMHPDDRARLRHIVEKSLESGHACEYMARYCAPDGRVRVHLVHTLPLPDEDGHVSRALGVIQDVTEHAKSQQELHRLSQQLMNEQDNQRRYLARELHESAGQSLAALKMTLGRLREALPEDSSLAASLLESAFLLADGAVREVRTVSYLLHPPLLDDAGLASALRWYAKGFSERSGIRAVVEIPDPFNRYSQEIETTVFRVVQEALTNVHRYSGSAVAEIRVSQRDSQLRVEVQDHGCGLAAPAAGSHRSFGLGVGISGMRERVQQLDGTFELRSVPGQGAVVSVLLPATPLKPAARAGRNERAVQRQ
jgi:signal transduction histidine kinase